jgi:hypothetical protein
MFNSLGKSGFELQETYGSMTETIGLTAVGVVGILPCLYPARSRRRRRSSRSWVAVAAELARPRGGWCLARYHARRRAALGRGAAFHPGSV